MKKHLKKLILLVVILVAGVYLISWSGDGKVDKVDVEIGASSKYDQGELEEAISCIKEEFRQEYSGCRLYKVYYNEEFSDKEVKSLEYKDKKSMIAIQAEYFVGPWGDSTEEKYTEIDDWCWILQKNEKTEKWEIVTSGSIGV